MKRDDKGRILPGQQSLNPSGRPKSAKDLAFKASAFDDECIALYLTVLRNKRARPADRMKAADELLNRGFGRAQQKIELEGGDPEKPVTTAALTPDQLLEIISAGKQVENDV